jgi:quinol monooxygenase YgiN
MSKRLTVLFTSKDGEAENFKQAAGAGISKVKAEDEGCEMYDLFQSVDDPNAFVLVESWASQDALDAHGKSDAMAEMGKIGPFMEGRPTLYRYED